LNGINDTSQYIFSASSILVLNPGIYEIYSKLVFNTKNNVQSNSTTNIIMKLYNGSTIIPGGTSYSSLIWNTGFNNLFTNTSSYNTECSGDVRVIVKLNTISSISLKTSSGNSNSPSVFSQLLISSAYVSIFSISKLSS